MKWAWPYTGMMMLQTGLMVSFYLSAALGRSRKPRPCARTSIISIRSCLLTFLPLNHPAMPSSPSRSLKASEVVQLSASLNTGTVV